MICAQLRLSQCLRSTVGLVVADDATLSCNQKIYPLHKKTDSDKAISGNSIFAPPRQCFLTMARDINKNGDFSLKAQLLPGVQKTPGTL